jgi:primosomal replication protein N
LKWLLNERAALQGLLAKHQARSRTLQGRVVQAELVAQERRAQLEAQFARQQACELAINSLERTIALAHPLVDPSSVPPVAAWAGRFGQRGDLIRFLRSTIETAGPAGCSTAQLVGAVRDAFALAPATKAERNALRFAVYGRLCELRDRDGVIESERTGTHHNSATVWRLRPPPVLGDLRNLAAATEAVDDAPPDPDAL